MLEFVSGLLVGAYLGTHYDCSVALQQVLHAVHDRLPARRQRGESWMH